MDNIYHFIVQHGEVFGIRFCDDFNYQTMTAVYTPLAPVWQQNEINTLVVHSQWMLLVV